MISKWQSQHRYKKRLQLLFALSFSWFISFVFSIALRGIFTVVLWINILFLITYLVVAWQVGKRELSKSDIEPSVALAKRSSPIISVDKSGSLEGLFDPPAKEVNTTAEDEEFLKQNLQNSYRNRNRKAS